MMKVKIERIVDEVLDIRSFRLVFIADSVLLLIADNATSVTGACWDINGGLFMRSEAAINCGGDAFVARELAPAGLRSGPRTSGDHEDFCVCCASEREQAPSPQETHHHRTVCDPRLNRTNSIQVMQ